MPTVFLMGRVIQDHYALGANISQSTLLAMSIQLVHLQKAETNVGLNVISEKVMVSSYA